MSRTLQLLLLLLLAGLVRADVSVRPSNNVTDGPHSCGGVDIPYPYGIMDVDGNGDFRKGFGVVCKEGKPGQPTNGGRNSFPIGNFSIETAEVRAWLPVVWQCYDDSSKVNDSYNVYIQIHEKGVHRISNTRNDLFVLGCNTLGCLASKPELNGNYTYYAQYTGCLSYCDNPQSAVSGACSGVGCCHADIPANLVDNGLAFDDSYDHSYLLDFSPCDYAFVAEKDHYTFDVADLKMHLHGRRKRRLMPVILDWAIRDNLTCKEAKRKEDYACKSSHSLCLNATNGPGYICKCRKGYEGNPYILDGCTDINECERLGHHYHCKGDCKNKQGYYECTCPKNTHGVDPYNEGCIPDFPRKAKIIIDQHDYSYDRYFDDEVRVDVEDDYISFEQFKLMNAPTVVPLVVSYAELPNYRSC